MALQKQFTTRDKFNVPAAYIKLKVCKYDADEKLVIAMFSIFKDSSKEILLDSVVINFQPDMGLLSKNFVKQSYVKLKEEASMEGSTDV